MAPRAHALAAIVSALLLAHCGEEATPAPASPCAPAPSAAPPVAISDAGAAAPAPPTVQEAQAFVAGVEADLRRLWVARDRAGWVNQNFITDDTEALSAAGEEATAAYVAEAVKRARRFDPIRAELPPDVARKLMLLALSQTIPAPNDAKEREELANIESWMTSMYGKGKYCPPNGSPLLKYREKGEACLTLDDLSRVLSKSRDFAELVEAWRGWHQNGAPMRERFSRYVTLANEGAREIGFADVGALWRSGYDMSAADFEADIERLWTDVKPLYDELHCYVRGKLQAKYGKDKVPDHAPIPAQLLGNMWAQEWGNVYDLVAPYPHEPSVDIGPKLVAGSAAGPKGSAANESAAGPKGSAANERWDGKRMVEQGEHFFTSLGFDPLPKSFWERSLFERPRDRDVVCHASAWDVTWSGDLRIKMCIHPTEEDFVTIHHELGHDFYFQRYVNLPILFQQGANDGFHEAIGDTMALSVTPAYLKDLGLLAARPTGGGGAPRNETGDHARINQQMRMALDKIAFLPFGLLIDKWRWDVFAGKVTPADYEAAWWKLKERYQGVRAPVARTEDDFDPAAKYHVAGSTPYVRYFLARIYQFQFHKALCEAAGYKGPLDQCSIHDNKAAGAKLMAMLSMGASKPWPDAMEAVGAGRKADARPMIEYFEPLRAWLASENKGQACGW